MYTEEASIDMDINVKYMNMHMDMDAKFHIHGNHSKQINCRQQTSPQCWIL